MEASKVLHKKKLFAPKLRFKGFDGNWTVKTLDEIVNVIDCKHRTPEYVENGIPVVSPGSIKWGEIDLLSPTKRVIESEYESLMDHCIPKKGDLVFSRNQSIGVASILFNENKFVLGQDTVLIQAKTVNSIFNYYRLQTDSVQTLISKLSGGSTFARINLKDLRKLKLTIVDSKSEQQKIASFLSAIDKKIRQLTRKKELLEQYKKGVMQQLFSGKLRFKDEIGKEFLNWEEKKLGNCLKSVSTKQYQIQSKDYQLSGQYKVIDQGKDLIAGYSDNRSLLFTNTPIIVFGDHTTIMKYLDFEFIVGADGTKLLKNIGQHNLKYLFYNLSFNNVKQEGYKRHFSILSEVFLQIPDLKEQKKIANYLSNIDNKIEIINNQITQTETFKKGLLQQMFV